MSDVAEATQTNQTAVVAPVELTKEETFKYRFKKDDAGNLRPSFALKVLVPTTAGLAAAINSGDEKQIALLHEAVQDLINGAIKTWVGEKEENGAAAFKPEEWTWAKIANMEKLDRRSSAISKEVWDAFAKDYLEVMTAVAGRTPEQVAAALQVYQKKFSILKSNKEMIKKLKGQLGVYIVNTKKAEDFQEILELLDKKSDEYLASDDMEALMKNLA